MKKVAEYSLHVLPNGFEVRIAALPNKDALPGINVLREGEQVLPVHHVTVYEIDGELVEEIEVRSIKINHGETFIYPAPHGERWVKWDPDARDPENYTRYRRPHRKGQTFATMADWLKDWSAWSYPVAER